MSDQPRARFQPVVAFGNFNFFKGDVMQKVQMGGGVISPTVAAHVQKTSMRLPEASSFAFRSDSPARGGPSTTELGGGGMGPSVKKHIANSANVHMGGGGIISPCVENHVSKSAKVSMGGGTVHPHVAKHILQQ